MGSDKIATMRERLLILTLLITKTDGAKEEVVIEMTKEQLDEFLEKCQDINSALRTFI
jgi:hypothetical protein